MEMKTPHPVLMRKNMTTLFMMRKNMMQRRKRKRRKRKIAVGALGDSACTAHYMLENRNDTSF